MILQSVLIMAKEIAEQDYSRLLNELRVARSEIFNLRQQIRSLKYSQEKQIEDLHSKILNWNCPGCKVNDESAGNVLQEDGNDKKNIVLEPIGYVSTEFPMKKGIPRQTSLCPQLLGKLTILKNVFTNPEHALEGLNEYSHMWILFYFHRNESKHALAKVSPPRLNGDKTGVFATRSPHRPSPIGLSLVRIDCIQGSTIYFSGVDMLDKTPVLDIKPYIPQYDDPSEQELESNKESLVVKNMPIPPGSPGIYPGNREDPDGEESDEEHGITTFVHPLPQVENCQAQECPSQGMLAKVGIAGGLSMAYGQLNVRVPSWVVSSIPKTIILTNEAEEQLQNLGKAELKPVIQRILNEDPRSNYIKQRYFNQFYTFLISDLHISCKFDDSANSVNVYRISRATRLSAEIETPHEKV